MAFTPLFRALFQIVTQGPGGYVRFFIALHGGRIA